ncbi:MAG: YjjG family noncanonical pyrimidine nucleotidase [Bacteroidales bacterium]|jgi:putative hydrolase of the HAD superfamily|nr:YjjG family noncanonical pyrimidine nucleotidase [Bacteroidales bacterium]
MKNKRYRHIFIDLDKTIWDFESNTRLTFGEIFEKYRLDAIGITHLQHFSEVYTRINDLLWGLYRENKIKKEVLTIRRFELTLNEFGIDDLILATQIAEDFIHLSPQKTILFPHSREALNYLELRYALHIITNGFEEVQQKKLDVCDLRKYFTTITTSEEAGVKKPESGIFELALDKAKARPDESLMIGDDLLVDMAGARSTGIDTLFFNPQRHVYEDDLDHEVHSWDEVMKIL